MSPSYTPDQVASIMDGIMHAQVNDFYCKKNILFYFIKPMPCEIYTIDAGFVFS